MGYIGYLVGLHFGLNMALKSFQPIVTTLYLNSELLGEMLRILNAVKKIQPRLTS